MFELSTEQLESMCRQAERHEGCKLRPYRCTAKKLTIGIGYNFEDRGLAEFERTIGRKIDGYVTVDEARAQCKADILAIGRQLARALPWFVTLDPVRQRALIDMGFMGVPKLLKFTTTLPAIARGDWPTAKAGILGSKWARDVKEARAGAVASMVETGVDPF